MQRKAPYRSLALAMKPERLVGDMAIMKPPPQKASTQDSTPNNKAEPKNHSLHRG